MEARRICLEEATKCVCTDRESQYGDPEDNFKRIAGMWSEYLGHCVTSVDVCMMMTMLKIARIKTGTHQDDNFIDGAGYMVPGW